MKTTAMCRFDGISILVMDNNSLIFENYDELENYCKEKGIKIEVSHWHPASGLRIQKTGG